MKLFIPVLKTKMVLTKPFTFNLHDETRNDKFWEKLHGTVGGIKLGVYKGEYSRYKPAKPISTTLPAGTVLSVDRIFIRDGARDFNSITFRVIKTKGISVPVGRFWVKLDEINNKLEANILDESVPWPNGRFTLKIVRSHCDDWCKHCKDAEVLCWTKNPNNRYSFGFEVARYVDTDSIQLMEGTYNFNNDAHYKIYQKSFETLDELKNWAKEKQFTLAHFVEFEKKYNKSLKPAVVQVEK